MLTPDGESAAKIEKVMLLALWANSINERASLEESRKTRRFIFAGLGKPTYPIDSHTIDAYLSYWQKIEAQVKKWHLNAESEQEAPAIDYGDSRGDKEARALMAKSMTLWYDSEIKAENILFTTGGIGALRIIFEAFNDGNKAIPRYRIITPFPYYSAYSNNSRHRLHPIHVMEEIGYHLTAQALEISIKEAYLLAASDGEWPKAVLICNPSNPLGTVINLEEMKKIANVLRAYPDLYLIIDEAYVEMVYCAFPSLLKMAPDLKNRVIIIRSATKAFSAAGERMAVLIAFNRKLMTDFLEKAISYFVHAPRSAQNAYAKTMTNFSENKRNELASFYKKKVDYVIGRLVAMRAAMPDPSYRVEATFYALGNFSDLMGLELPEAATNILQKEKRSKVCTGEDLAYYLLFEDLIMITPLSYFGLPKNCGFIRITCSGDMMELRELMDRLEHRLLAARREKYNILMDKVSAVIQQLNSVNPLLHLFFYQEKISYCSKQSSNCTEYADQNRILENLLLKINRATTHPPKVSIASARSFEERRINAALIIQSVFRKNRVIAQEKKSRDQLEKDWRKLVDSYFSDSPLKDYFLALNIKDRNNFFPWKKYLEGKGNIQVNSDAICSYSLSYGT